MAWALHDNLNVKCKVNCNAGRYPYATDVHNDGRNELMAGYTPFDDDGRV